MDKSAVARPDVSESLHQSILRAKERSHLRELQRGIKRVVEWVVALVLLVLTLPIQLLIALAIKLDSPGPVLFIQERLGRQGKIFKMLKFRTLRWGRGVAPVLNPDGSTRVDADDPRLTRVGRWLRTGWDELPQLVNVVRGEMALIGPRPDEPFHRASYTEEEERKLTVLPGITGLPQATGRNTIPWKQRIALDLHYIDNYSIWLDLKILFRTCLTLLRLQGDSTVEPKKTQI
jgi:lipopolysaccharide/colanic/teichoic acid biosynthesis glycosyltransferase